MFARGSANSIEGAIEIVDNISPDIITADSTASGLGWYATAGIFILEVAILTYRFYNSP
jgi:hypothetical protein